MNDIIPFVWVLIIVLSAVVEMASLNLISIWFIPSALVAFILSLLSVPVWIQSTVFFVISIVLLVLSKTILKDVIKLRPIATNADTNIGKTAVVVEDINPNAPGTVRIRGQIWTAALSPDEVQDTIRSGELVYVSAIEGVKLICARTDSGK